MRSLALVAASLAGNAFAVPMLKERALVTDLDIVTITQYVTATGPCPTTGVTNTVSVTEQAVSSSSVSSYVVVTSYTSSAVPETTPAETVVPSVVTVNPVPASSSSVVESVAPSSTYVAPTSTYVAPTTSATPLTTATPSTTAVPSSSAAAGGFSYAAYCPTSSLDASASLTTAPADAAAKRWLAFHNAHRANHTDGCSLYWDNDLASKALATANKCAYTHDNDGQNWGQNMGQMTYTAGTGGSISDTNVDQSAAYFSHMYYQEYEIFGPYWGADSVPVDGANPPNILHFTQMVWKDTYSVGCATAVCDSDLKMLTFCNYRSRGNILGEYGEQVKTFISNPLPPICSEISSTATDGSCITDAELGL